MDLLKDLFCAYYDARRNKRNTPSQLRFESHLEQNLIELYEELRDHRYKPRPCSCFVIEDPVKREVFASDFRDRVVHHLYYNYFAPIFERLFIYDSYSCREKKGTLFGIKRIEHHLRSVTNNYTQEAYILKLDIQGYFMSIRRELLLETVLKSLGKCWNRKITKTDLKSGFRALTWADVVPRELVEWLSKVIIMKDPLKNCHVHGRESDWDGLPPTKSLRFSPQNVGLPIGDLTSQLFSNVLLNDLDWYVTRTLGFTHYGRYVDDFYLCSKDKEALKKAVGEIRDFLATMGLTLHPKKIVLQRASERIRFLGAEIFPYYRRVRSRTVVKYHRVCGELNRQNQQEPFDFQRWKDVRSVLNSYLGYFSHFRTYKWLSRNEEASFVEPFLRMQLSARTLAFSLWTTQK